MATKKRKAEEMEVAEVFTPQECVTIHDVVTEVSPFKCRKKNDKIKYFAGKLTDGKIRIVLWEKKKWFFTGRSVLQGWERACKKFHGNKYLSVPNKCTIEDIDKIDDVVEMDSDHEWPTVTSVFLSISPKKQ